MRPARPSPLHELPMSHDPRTDHRLPAARRLPMLALPAALLACASPALAADANTADATTLDTIQVTAPIVKDTGTATKTDTPLVEVPQSIRSEEHPSELQSLMRISYAVF